MGVGFSNIADIAAKLQKFWGGNQATGNVLTFQGEGVSPQGAPGAGGGLFVQEGYDEDKTLTRFASATIPFDATIPQITEGQEVLRVAYTPLSMSNILWVESFCFMGSGTVGRSMLFNCFFEDATANAFATGWSFTDAGTQDPMNVPCFFRGVASVIGVGPVLDISVRIGQNVVSALNFNGQENAVLQLGATKTSFLRILERAP